MTLARTKQLGLPSKADLFEAGYLKSGMIVELTGIENSDATVVNQMKVKYRGAEMSFNNWGKLVTGWKSISLFSSCRVKAGRTFQELRDQFIRDHR